MAEKSNLQTFISDWGKISSWASGNKIHNTSIMPVYQMDLKRLQANEYPMSQAERMRAILAASNLKTGQVLPTDIRDPTQVLTNSKHDLANIFTGLSGIFTGSMERNLFDTAKAALIDPTSSHLWAAADQWFPGASVADQILHHGFEGVNEVETHPIVSLLDVLPLAATGLRVAARAGLAGSIAERAGLSVDQLAAPVSHGGVGVVRVAGRMISRIPLPGEAKLVGAPARDLGGLTTPARTIGTKVNDLLHNPMARSHVVEEALKTAQRGTHMNVALSRPFHVAMQKLSDTERHETLSLLTTSGRSRPDIMTDDGISTDVKTAIKAYEPLLNWFQEKQLSTGEATLLRMPNGSHEYYLAKDIPVKAMSTLKTAQDLLDRRSGPLDHMAAQIESADFHAAPFIDHLSEVTARIRPSLPTSMSVVANRSLTDIFGDGGLMDQLAKAYHDNDFAALKHILRQVNRRFDTKSLNALNSPQLADVARTFYDVYQYSMFRSKLEKSYLGEFSKIAPLMERASKAQAAFDKAVLRHPPARYVPLFNEIFASNLAKHLQAAGKFDAALTKLGELGHDEDQLKAARTDPRLMAEYISLATSASTEDPFIGIVDMSDVKDVESSALQELAHTRALGYTAALEHKAIPTERDFGPTYVPSISSHQLSVIGRASYNVPISLIHLPTVDMAKSRLFDFTNTVYEMNAAISKAMKQQLARDAALDFANHYMPQFEYRADELLKLARQLRLIPTNTDVASIPAHAEAIFARNFGLKAYDPEKLFGISVPRIRPGATYIPKDIADALENLTRRDIELHGVIRKGTAIFRGSVLYFSPRFTAHILFGGSFLVGLRGHANMVRFLGHATRLASAISHQDPDAIRSVLTPLLGEGIDPFDAMVGLQHRMAQAGSEDEVVHYVDDAALFAGGRQLGNMVLHEIMDRAKFDKGKLSSWITAGAQFNMRFTSHVVLMQRSLTYLDGADRLLRYSGHHEGMMLDELGHKVKTTPARASFEGIKAANKVMGDLRQMTPFERNIMTQVMPFYGWTKHILRYVASYPMDHPYRAMFLSNLANMGSEQVPSGLPTRIQLLFFLGAPSASGNVTAIEARALNPLRDVESYFTLAGLVSTLNPIVSGLIQAQDPEAVYGGVPLYPNLGYSDLYGVESASAPGGGLLSAVESYVPQVQAADIALDLSGQYRNLRKTNPGAYINDLTTALGIPFAPEKINVKQMAAKASIAQYHVAAQLASDAWQSGDFSHIMGLPSVPNPLNADYNITPKELKSLWDHYSRVQPGIGAAEIAPPLPSPSL